MHKRLTETRKGHKVKFEQVHLQMDLFSEHPQVLESNKTKKQEWPPKCKHLLQAASRNPRNQNNRTPFLNIQARNFLKKTELFSYP